MISNKTLSCVSGKKKCFSG